MAVSTGTSVSPGNFTVSLAEIIDRLRGIPLSDAQIDQFLAAIVSKRKSAVLPGDLITAELMNQVLAELSDLQVRVANLEDAGASGSASPTVGYIAVSWQGSPRGKNVVPNDSNPFPHTFALVNNTNKNLTFMLKATITGAAGDWSQAALFDNNLATRSIQVPSDGQVLVTVNVRAPSSGTKLGDTPVLTLDAKTPSPDNLPGSDAVKLLVASTAGDPVVRTLRLMDTAEPRDFKPGPVGTDGKIGQGKTGSFAFSYKYDDTTTPPPDPGFILEATVEPGDLSGDPTALWDFEMQGATPDSDSTNNHVRTLTSAVASLPLGQTTALSVSLTAPAQATRIKFTVTLKSTKLHDQPLEVPSKTYVIASV